MNKRQLKKQLTYHIRTTKSMRNERDFYKKRYKELDEKISVAFCGLKEARENHSELLTNHKTLKTEIHALARLIHYPEHWDTMAYPTLATALKEISCNECKTNKGAT